MTDKRNTKRKKTGGFRVSFLFAAALTLLTACGSPPSGESGERESQSSASEADTGFVTTGPDSYDSADTAILVDADGQARTVTLLNLDVGRRYTLSMDGTTRFYDKYGDGISFSQIQLGDIVDVTFLRSQKHLTTMKLSPAAWVYGDVERYEINSVRGEVSIGSEIYKLTSNTQYLSEQRAIDVSDINAVDVLSFQGIDSQVLSIRVEKGHGYLRLANDENFVGGWIEVGQSSIRRITEDMLLLVPEGSYQVSVSNKGGGGTKHVTINRNEETELDIGDLKIPEPQYGTVLFSLSPSKAELYVDGSSVDPSQPIRLLYGIHQIIARAEGYQSVTQYIRVGQESAGINVILDKNPTEEGSAGSSSELPSATDAVTDYFKVYIDAPEGVEVYLDGNYVGTSPCSFRKNAGKHIITLRKTGVGTRSYTVQIDDKERDISYSFADLEKEGSSSLDSIVNDVFNSSLFR